MSERGAERLSDRAVQGMFYEAMEHGPMSWVNDLSFHVMSDQESEDYTWLGMTPRMREWVGGRQTRELRSQIFTIRNVEYEATLTIKDKHLRRDKTGQLQVRIGEFADTALDHDAELLTTLIEGGAAAICYDGQYFFDTDHSEGDSGTQDNDLTATAATGTTPTPAELEGAVMTSIQQMFGYKDDQGRPINQTARDFDIMVPVGMWQTAMSALNSEIILEGGQARNNLVKVARSVINGFGINLVVNPRLTNSAVFYTFRKDARTAPFIRQEEVPVQTSMLGITSDHFFKHREVQLGLYASKAMGYGMWQQAVRMQFT